MRRPFERSWHQYRAGRLEFDAFRELAEETIRAACKNAPGFDEMKDAHGFYVTLEDPDTVQAWFGKRHMRRRDLEGKAAIEAGTCLLYSFGAAGDVVIALYPAKSSLAAVAEDQIYIGLGRYSAHQLRQRVTHDVRALVAYGYVSSLDAEATWREWLRIEWLRRIKPSQVKGEFVAGKSKLIGVSLQAAYRSALIGAFTAVMRPVGYIVLALLLVRYGKAEWIDYFRSK